MNPFVVRIKQFRSYGNYERLTNLAGEWYDLIKDAKGSVQLANYLLEIVEESEIEYFVELATQLAKPLREKLLPKLATNKSLDVRLKLISNFYRLTVEELQQLVALIPLDTWYDV